MEDMLVAPDRRKHAYPNDFGAEISAGTLLVPENVAEALARLSVHTAEEFVSQLRAFPTAMAHELGWDIKEVRTATDRLINALRGALPDEILDPPPSPRRRYGALNPERLRRRP
jgi:hypothetical protein